jgi:uncharacterized protein with beta-barrel porin domain
VTVSEGSALYTNSGTSISATLGRTFGEYSGYGTFNGVNFIVESTGSLVPGFPIGTLQFNSDVIFSTGSRIVAQIDPIATGQKADLVSSSGTLRQIDNATIVVQPARLGLTPQDYASGNDYTVATALSVDGSSPTVVAGGLLPALAVPRIANDPQADGRIDIAFDALPASQLPLNPGVSQSPNASNLAGAVATAAITAPGTALVSGSTVSAAVNTLTNEQLSWFNTVHAEPYSSFLTVGLEQLDMISNGVLRHTRCAGFIGAELAVQNGPEASVAFDPSNRKDTSNSCADRRWWIDAVGVRGNVDGENDLGTFDYSVSALLLGADLLTFDNAVTGLFAGVGRSSMDEHDQVVQDFSSDDYHLGVYGRFATGQWDIAAVLGISSGQVDASRNNSSLGAFTGGVARSEFDQTGFHASVLAKRNWALQKSANIASVLGLNYGRIRQDAASETGGGDFNYDIESADAESLTASVGLEYSKDYATWNGLFKPIAFARYEYDFLANKNSEHEVTVTSPVFGTFTQTGQNRGAHGLAFGLGASYEISDSVQFSAGYGYSVRSNGEEHGLGANLRIVF